jgi:hypothetical protein
MNPVVVRVNEVIGTPNAILGSQGSKLYTALKEALERGQAVVLDFDGIRVLNSGFCNAAVGRVYRERGIEANQFIKVENLLNERMQAALNDAIALGQNPNLLKAMQETMEAEFRSRPDE